MDQCQLVPSEDGTDVAQAQQNGLGEQPCENCLLPQIATRPRSQDAAVRAKAEMGADFIIGNFRPRNGNINPKRRRFIASPKPGESSDEFGGGTVHPG